MFNKHFGFLLCCVSLVIALPVLAQEATSVGERSGFPLDRNPSEALKAKSSGRKVVVPEIFAKADLQPRSDSSALGTVEFRRTEDAIIVFMNVSNVKPGKHGIHIHEKGDCSAKDAASAGDHYNPHGRVHGSPSAALAHLGDLGNVTVNKHGSGATTLTIPRKSSNMAAEWQEIVGRSVILHEKEDDLKTQPAGNSGDRIACGVIKAASNLTAH